jgi:hypothetical protein
MKAIAYKLYMCICFVAILLFLIDTAVAVYLRTTAEDGVYDVTYLEQIDATCVKSIYQGDVVMDCMDGKRLIKEAP